MNNKNTYDVLITYAWVRSSYVAVRSLNSLGLKVAVADERKVGMSQWSNKAKFVGLYSSPLKDPEKFISDLTDIINKTGVKFLLPSHDETEVIAKYRNRLPKDIILPIANYSSIKQANNKSDTAQIAMDSKVPVPSTLQWSNNKELESILYNSNISDYVVKLRKGNSSKGVFYPTSKEGVISTVKNLRHKYHLGEDRLPIVQERIEGDGWGVSCLYWEGKRISFFTHRRIKEKIATGGTSTLRISEKNELLESYAFSILDKMNWHGLAMVEFKYNKETKQGWFIEINPRLWGSLHLAISSGVDFPKQLYIVATEGTKVVKNYVNEQKEGVIARWYMGDMITSVSSMCQLRPIESMKSLLPGGCNTYDDIHIDDLGAFAGEITGYLSTFLSHRSLNPEKDGMLG